MVEHIAAGGAGIVHRGGKTVFIDDTVPGDHIHGRIIEEHPLWDRAELAEIIEPSPERTEAPCPFFRRCGGCTLQHMSYDAQVREKTSLFTDTLRRIGALENLPELRVRDSAPFEYRNRMQFHQRSSGGTDGGRTPGQRLHLKHRGRQAGTGAAGFHIGLKEKHGNGIIPLDDCPIADPGIRRALQNRTLRPPPDRDRFTVYSRDGLFLSQGGTEKGTVRVLDRDIRMDVSGFFQSNGGCLEKMIRDLRLIASRADSSLPMADIYCGVGTFAAFLQDYFPRIDLVEENRAALALARDNVSAAYARFFPRRADDWVRSRDSGNYGFMVLDPPRNGLSPLLRKWLVSAGPPLFAYISCDSATLARDCRELAGSAAYILTELYYYDFYPQTAHMEGMAVFSRTGGGG